MFDRAAATMIAIAAACAAAALTIFAAGFALYALTAPTLGQAGAAGLVALAGAVLLCLMAAFAALRARKHERDTLQAQAALMDQLPPEFDAVARERPFVTLALTALTGMMAARNPRLVRDLLSILARFSQR